MGLVLAHLYPSLMNLYGDRGNIICLKQRCARRGVRLEVREIGISDDLSFKYDILFMGGGQDKEQKRAADDLQEKAVAIREAIESGVVALVVCGGYQLFGRYYQPAEGPRLEGIGVFDAWTVHQGSHVPRCIGNVVAEWEGKLLVGFENHGGRTYLGPGARPLAKVVSGHGNNSEDGSEGAVYRNAFGTYLHGSLLPKNPQFADHLLRLALERRHPGFELQALEDVLETQAHEAAVGMVRQRQGWLSRLLR
ncbi:MAG: glutamine amidotransferase [Chloroflexi bacterium]|nr:glutamine amidotransferase [Chloroflexota bacterium]